jgi:transposase
MPRPHREYAEWTPRRLVEWAQKTGPATAELVEQILTRRRHPQQGFRSCLGILRLGKSVGEHRLEAACRRALHIGAASYKSIESILKHKLDQEPLPAPAEPALPLDHDNVRGPKYYL